MKIENFIAELVKIFGIYNDEHETIKWVKKNN